MNVRWIVSAAVLVAGCRFGGDGQAGRSKSRQADQIELPASIKGMHSLVGVTADLRRVYFTQYDWRQRTHQTLVYDAEHKKVARMVELLPKEEREGLRSLKSSGLSPDGRHVLLSADERAAYVHEIAKGTTARLPVEHTAASPVWLGNSIVLGCFDEGRKEMLPLRRYTPEGKRLPLRELYGMPVGASEDGRYILLAALGGDHTKKPDLEAKGRADQKPRLLLIDPEGKVFRNMPFSLFGAPVLVSPNGKWAASSQLAPGVPKGDYTTDFKAFSLDGAKAYKWRAVAGLLGVTDFGQAITRDINLGSRASGSTAIRVRSGAERSRTLAPMSYKAVMQGEMLYYAQRRKDGRLVVKALPLPEAEAKEGSPD